MKRFLPKSNRFKCKLCSNSTRARLDSMLQGEHANHCTPVPLELLDREIFYFGCPLKKDSPNSSKFKYFDGQSNIHFAYLNLPGNIIGSRFLL